jgi:hypothetical protein
MRPRKQSRRGFLKGTTSLAMLESLPLRATAATDFDAARFSELADQLDGDLVVPGHPAYESAGREPEYPAMISAPATRIAKLTCQ